MIDTIEKEYSTENIDIEKLIKEPMVLGKTVKINNGFVKLGLRPSKEVNRGVSLIPSRESLERIKNMETRNNLDCGKVTQLHYAIDVDGNLNDDYKKFKLFLECLLASRKWKRNGKEVFRTFKNDDEIGNMKIKNSYRSTTVYDCTDKRKIGIRFEDRENIRTIKIGTLQAVNEGVERLLGELEKIESFIEIVEAEKIKNILKEYVKNKGSYSSFREFVSNQEEKGAILTRNILVGVFKGAGMKVSVTDFIKNFKRTRPNKLNFVSKTEIKKLGDSIKKEIKKDMKDLKLMGE